MVQSSGSISEIEAVMRTVSDLIREVSEKARTKIIRPETLLLDDLALDSLDMVRVVMLIEDRHGVCIDLDDVADMKTVGDVARTLHREASAAA